MKPLIFGMRISIGASEAGAEGGPLALSGIMDKERGDLVYGVSTKLSYFECSAEDKPATLASIYPEVETFFKSAKSQERFPIIIGGDHSMSALSGAACSSILNNGEPIAIVWIDAHGDINTPETSPSGNLHGMPLRILSGEGYQELVSLGGYSKKVNFEDIYLLGVRDLDEGEVNFIHTKQIYSLSAVDIKKKGARAVADEVRKSIEASGKGFLVSFDLDSIDPEYAPGVGTPVGKGLSPDEVLELFDVFLKSNALLAIECVELNPARDTSGHSSRLSLRLMHEIVALLEAGEVV